MNRLEKIDAWVTPRTAEGMVGGAVWVPDLAALVAVARAARALVAIESIIVNARDHGDHEREYAALLDQVQERGELMDALAPLLEAIADE